MKLAAMAQGCGKECTAVMFHDAGVPETATYGAHGGTLRWCDHGCDKETGTWFWLKLIKGAPLDTFGHMHACKLDEGGGKTFMAGFAKAALATPAFADALTIIPLGGSNALEPGPETPPVRLAAELAGAAEATGRAWTVAHPSTLPRRFKIGKVSGKDLATKREMLDGIYAVPDNDLERIRALAGRDVMLLDDDAKDDTSMDAAYRELVDAMKRAGVHFRIHRVVLGRYLSQFVKLEAGSTMAELDEETHNLVEKAAFEVLEAKECDDAEGQHLTVIYWFIIGGRLYVGSHLGSLKLVDAAFSARFMDARRRGDAAAVEELALQIAEERIKEHATKVTSAKGHNQEVRFPQTPARPLRLPEQRAIARRRRRSCRRSRFWATTPTTSRPRATGASSRSSPTARARAATR